VEKNGKMEEPKEEEDVKRWRNNSVICKGRIIFLCVIEVDS
jgi:hypothetical protein